MSISLAQAWARVFTVLSGVAGITGGVATVHDYFRTATDEAAQKTLFRGSSGRLHVWMVDLQDGDPYITVGPTGSPGRYPLNYEQAVYRFALYGWYAHNDAAASSKAWADQVEAVIAKFRADKKLTLGDPVTNPPVIDSGPAQWAEGGHRMFGGVLCHFGRLLMPVKVQTEP
jgi:hypothetical protein